MATTPIVEHRRSAGRTGKPTRASARLRGKERTLKIKNQTILRGIARGAASALMVLLLLCLRVAPAASNQDEPYKYFRQYVGLNDSEIADLRAGKAIAKVMESRSNFN